MRVLLRVCAVAAAFAMASAVAAEPNDLREIRVGMAASALPSSGYSGFACAADAKIVLEGWADWRRCPADGAGLHSVRFRYSIGDTTVAGHQVLLTLLLGEPGQVDGLRIETDPAARLYLHKKAYLLGSQARSRFGDDGWTCTEGSPTADAEPVGGAFVEERCEKTADGRHLTIERHLFRRPDRALKEFVGESRISIMLEH